MTERVDQERLRSAGPMLPPRTSASARARWLSAAVLVPVGLWLVWQGGWLFAGGVALVAVLMAFEWTRLVHGAGVLTVFYLHALIAVLSIGAVAAGEPVLGFLVVAVGVALAAFVARLTHREPAWSVIGIVYTTVPLICMVWIRAHGEYGLEVVVSLLFVIWATDTGAYFAGKAIGGPKLVPKVSPSKTWAGLAGGIFWAGVIGATAAYVADFRPIVVFAALGASLAVVAQVGDIAESAVKRHFHAKDTSGFIPGHGGVLDRFDGLMFAALAVAVLLFARQGMT